MKRKMQIADYRLQIEEMRLPVSISILQSDSSKGRFSCFVIEREERGDLR
jgi:hypothetical protein